ncbi:hypothetical protein, partial [Nocardia farcinica]|uniref:hypothetical protein n=1 Tax=Nocardia farcinica TaxID=37329 RepID=UPI001BAEB551
MQFVHTAGQVDDRAQPAGGGEDEPVVGAGRAQGAQGGQRGEQIAEPERAQRQRHAHDVTETGSGTADSVTETVPAAPRATKSAAAYTARRTACSRSWPSA